jgi:MarR family transcriptional regulator, organic hydroperoxide resistance regulator
MSASSASGGDFFENFLPHLLTVAAAATSKAFDRKLREHGVSVPVWRVLAVLVEHSGETVSGLAKKCLLQQPTTSKLVDRMVRDRLVRRWSDDRDHRVVRVRVCTRNNPTICVGYNT